MVKCFKKSSGLKQNLGDLFVVTSSKALEQYMLPIFT